MQVSSRRLISSRASRMAGRAWALAAAQLFLSCHRESTQLFVAVSAPDTGSPNPTHLKAMLSRSSGAEDGATPGHDIEIDLPGTIGVVGEVGDLVQMKLDAIAYEDEGELVVEQRTLTTGFRRDEILLVRVVFSPLFCSNAPSCASPKCVALGCASGVVDTARFPAISREETKNEEAFFDEPEEVVRQYCTDDLRELDCGSGFRTCVRDVLPCPAGQACLDRIGRPCPEETFCSCR